MESLLSSDDSQRPRLDEPDEDSKPQDLSDEPDEDSKPQDLSDEPDEDSKPQDLSDELDEDSKLTDLSEQNEDSRSRDPDDQSEGGIQLHLEPSEQQSREERENSMTPVSGPCEKTSTDSVDEASSLFVPEPSTSSHLGFLSSDTSKLEDTHDLAWREVPQKIPELSDYETLPSSLWGNTRTEWKFERLGHPVLKQKPSFHSRCCNSAIEQTIKHSPQKLTKSSCLRGFMQERRAPNFKRSEIISPSKRIQKQRVPVAVMRKKESKQLFKSRPHTASGGLCEGHDSYLGRRSKVLHNLYTTFCDEEEQADPSFLQKEEESSTASGLSRACTIFSVLKKGRINVSNLLLTLHTLGILIARVDMHKSLKYISVDERGNLNFLEFLNVVSLTTLFSRTKALQKARRVFRKLKKDMVAVEDLEPILECLGVTLSSTIIEHALRHVQITWDGKLNISKFLSTVRGLQSCCDKKEYRDGYPSLNWRSFGDVNDYSVARWRRTGSSEGEIPAHRIPMITFCSAEEAIAYTQLQKRKSQPQRPVDLKRPSTASPVCLAEENKKKKGTIRWPKVRPGFGYTSRDSLFPLKSTLCSKKPKTVSRESEAEKLSCEDPPSLLSQPNISPKVDRRKKKLSFNVELPKRYSAEDTRVPSSTRSETEDSGSAEDPSAKQPSSDAEGNS